MDGWINGWVKIRMYECIDEIDKIDGYIDEIDRIDGSFLY